MIDGADITTVGQNWMAAGDWSSGDFNYDGFVDITDLWLLASNRRDSQYALDQALLDIGLLAVNAPEPSAMLVTAALLGLLPRRRSNRTVEKQ